MRIDLDLPIVSRYFTPFHAISVFSNMCGNKGAESKIFAKAGLTGFA